MARKLCPSCGYRYGRAAARCAIDGSALVALDDPLRGRLLAGRYRVGAELGAGAMATVYDGVDERTGAPVAIKVPDPETLADPALAQRFLREGRVGLAVRHPRVAATLDVGLDRDVHFLVMERLDGETLAARVSRGPLSVAEAVSYARQLADALAALHAQGVVHRDVKPSNVFLVAGSGPSERVRLLDLGVAHAAHEDALTASRAVLGTSRTMAPEQARGERATAASDLYALGAVLFEMLTGAPVFRGNDLAIRRAHLATPAPRVRSLRPDAPDDLDELVDVMLAKDPSRRPPSAAHVRERLDAFARHDDGATRLAGAHAPVVGDAPEVSLDPRLVADCHRALDALARGWSARSPALDGAARVRALEAEMRRLTLALVQLSADDAAGARRTELAMALCDDERQTLAASLRSGDVTAAALAPHLDAALDEAERVVAALRALRDSLGR